MPKNDNRKKFDFFQTRIDFWKKTKLTSLKTAVMKMISSYYAAGGASQWHMYLHYKIK